MNTTQAELWAVLRDRILQDEEIDEAVILALVDLLRGVPILRKWASTGRGSYVRRGLVTGTDESIHGNEPVRAVVSTSIDPEEPSGLWSVAVHARGGVTDRHVIPELRTATDDPNKGKRIADTHLRAHGALLLGGAP